jgi:hypothetical protein
LAQEELSPLYPLACSSATSDGAKVERGRERNVLLLLLLFASFVSFLSPERGTVPFKFPIVTIEVAADIDGGER